MLRATPDEVFGRWSPRPIARWRRGLLSAALLLVASGCGDGPKQRPAPPPMVSAVVPNHGALGTLVTISGTGFGADPAAVRITFRGALSGTATVAPASIASDALQIAVPSATGVTDVGELTVTVGGQASTPIPFTLEALVDPTAAAGDQYADFSAEVDAALTGLSALLDGVLVPALERSGQTFQAARIRSGAAKLRPAYASSLQAKRATKSPAELAVFDAVLGTEAMVAARAELARLSATLHPSALAGALRRDPRGGATLASIGIGGYDGGTAEDILEVKVFLDRAFDMVDKLDWALLGAIGAAGTASVIPGFESAAAIIPVLVDIRETIVKPILRFLELVIPLMDSVPTDVVGGTLRVATVANPLWIDQEFGSMESPIPSADTGAVLVLEPYGVKGYMSFKNDGGESLRSVGGDLAPELSAVGEALIELSGFDVGALQVTDVEVRLKLQTDHPETFRGVWAEPVLWIEALMPGLAEVVLQVDMSQVQATCPEGFTRHCVPAEQARVTRTMRAVAGSEAAAPFTQGPRLDTAQVEGRPPRTAHLGDTMLITGEGFTRDPQLAHQDVYLTTAPGYPLSGVFASPNQHHSEYGQFQCLVSDALSGPLTVRLAGHPSNALDFTILPPRLDPPPPSGIVGEYWALTGEGFSKTPSHNAGDWNGSRGPPDSGGYRNLEFTIPDGARSGPFKVVTLGVLESDPAAVTVRKFSEPAVLSAPDRTGLRPALARDASTGSWIFSWVDRNEKGAAQLVVSVMPGGAGPGTPVVLPASLGGHPGAPPRPAVAAAAGRFFAAWVDRAPGAGSRDRIVLSISDDGIVWSAPRTLSSHAGPARQPALAADGAIVALAWVNEAAASAGNSALRIVVSPNGGADFGAPLDWSTADASDPAVAVSGNAVAVAWSAGIAGGRSIVAVRSEDGGKLFQFPWTLGSATPGATARHPTVALGPSCVTPSIASVYLAWEQIAEGADLAEDVFFARIDGFIQASQNISRTPAHSQAPQLVVDADCIPALAWLELGLSKQQLLTNGVSGAFQPLPSELRFSRSFDGGASFSPRPLTLARLDDSRLGHVTMAGGGSALLTLAWQEDFGGPPVVAMRTTDGLGGAPATHPSAPPGEASSDLVYRGDSVDLWVSAPDGTSGLQRITRGYGSRAAPALSPDGRFISYLPSPDHMVMAEADGAHPLRVVTTADFVFAGNASWSPRGDFVAVASPYVPPKLGWLMPDGRELTIVGTARTPPGVAGATGQQPWSPDGHLVYAAGGALGRVDPKTGLAQALNPALPAGTSIYYPSWSPNGALLAFVVTTLAPEPGTLGTGDLYVYDAVIGTLTRLTTGGIDTTPTWSPDGRRLAFVRGLAGHHQVHIQAVDGPSGSDVNLTASLLLLDDTDPVFLPDGSGVAVYRRDAAGLPRTVAIDTVTLAVTSLSVALGGSPSVIHLGARPTWSASAGAFVNATGTTSGNLSWQGASDDTGIHHYEIWNGAVRVVGEIPAGSVGWSVTGLAPGTVYTFTIRACDAAGNCSLSGPSVTFTTEGAGVAPSWSSVPPELAQGPAYSPGPGYDTPYSVVVHWTAANEIGVEYRFFLNGSTTAWWVQTSGTTDYGALTGLRPGTPYTVRVQACFVAGGACTSDGPILAVTTATDATAPTMAGGAEVRGTVLTLQYDEPIEPSSTPAPADFAVLVSEVPGSPLARVVQSVTVREIESQVVLTLAQPVVAGEVATISYAPGSAPIRNTGGLGAAEFANQPVANGSYVTPAGIASTASDDVVTVGYFVGAARFGTTLLQSAGQGDGFVARRSAAGRWLWARRLGGSDWDAVQAVALDGTGTAYVAGAFSGDLSLVGLGGPINLTANGVADGFVAKLDADGQWVWAARMGGAGTSALPGPDSDAFNGGFSEGAQAVAIDAAGSVYAAGKFIGTASFGDTGPTVTSLGESDLWVGKLDASGAWQWAASAGSATGADVASGVATDGTSVFVTGAFQGVLEFPGLAGPLVSTGWQLVLAKLDGAGHWLWASDGGLLGGAGYSIMADGGGGVYLGGASASASIGGLSYRPYVARWSGAGTRLWAQTGSGSGQVTGLALDADDSVFAAGHFANNLSFGGVFLAGSFSDVFVARLAGADGAMGWALASGNTSSTFLTCNGATRCGAGRLCVVGAAASDSSAGSTYQFGAFTQFTGSSELFVAAAGETADVPPAGTWTALGTTEDAP